MEEEPSDQPTRSAFFARSKSRSFPRTSHEATAFEATNSSDLNAPLLQNLAYTSLKDLMKVSPRQKCRSPTKGLVVQSAYEIPITNMLLQKAAWAYLQPMPEENNAESRFSSKRICGHLKVFGNRIVWAIRYVVDRVLGALHHGGVEESAS